MKSVWIWIQDFGEDFSRSPISWMTFAIGMAVGILIRLPLVPWHLDGPAATIIGSGIGALLAVGGAAWIAQNKASRDERYARHQLRLFVEVVKEVAHKFGNEQEFTEKASEENVKMTSLKQRAKIQSFSKSIEQFLAELKGVERIVDKMRPTLSPTVEEIRHALQTCKESFDETVRWSEAIGSPSVTSHHRVQTQIWMATQALERSMSYAKLAARRDESMYRKTSRRDFAARLDDGQD